MRVPAQQEWTDRGTVVSAGVAGDWDAYLGDAVSPCSLVKIGDEYLLYYIGSAGERMGNDPGGRFRSVGVATSADGVEFVKRSDNPVLRYLPTPNGCNAEEEGVLSAHLFPVGSAVQAYFTGMTQKNCAEIQADVYASTSQDGFAFSSPSLVLQGTDPTLWGNNTADDVLLKGAFEVGGDFYALYETRDDFDLGVAHGAAANELTVTQPFLMASDTTHGGEVRGLHRVPLSDETAALFVVEAYAGDTRTELEVRVSEQSAASEVSSPSAVVQRYDFFDDGIYEVVVYLDADVDTWFMFYRERTAVAPIQLKTAPLVRQR